MPGLTDKLFIRRQMRLILAAAVLLFPLGLLAQEQITLTTYYPSPRGVYHELRAKRLSIGDASGANDYYDPGEVTWDTGSGGDIAADTDLVVQGRLGIGTVAPQEALEVAGNIRIDDGGDAYIENTSGYIGLRPGDTDHGLLLCDYTGTDTAQWSGLRHVDNGDNDRLEFSIEDSGYGSGLVLTQDNCVGVATTDPWQPLDVVGNVFLRQRLQLGGTYENWINDNVTGRTNGMHTNDGALLVPLYETPPPSPPWPATPSADINSDLRLYITDDAGDSFSIWGNTCSGTCGNLNDAKIVAHFEADGNVGIGTSSPEALLHIKADDTDEDSGIAIENPAGDCELRFWLDDTPEGIIQVNPLNPLRLITGGPFRMSSDSSATFTLMADEDNTHDDELAMIQLRRDGDDDESGYVFIEGPAEETAAGTLENALVIGTQSNIPLAFTHTLITTYARINADGASLGAVEFGTDTDPREHNIWGDLVAVDIAVTGSCTCSSSRAKKKDITPLQDADYQAILAKLNQTDVVRYRWKDKNLDQETHIGIISEDGPEEITSPDRENINLGDYLGFLLAAAKAQQAQLDQLKQKIER